MGASMRFRPPFPSFGVLPERTDDPAAAADLVRRHGAAVLTGLGTTEEAATAVPALVFGDAVLAVPPAAEVREAGGQDRRYAGVSQHHRLRCHTDGFSYGDHYPDYFLLLCEASSPEGGESMLVDGDALLDWVLADPDHAPFGERLLTAPVEQTEPGKRRSTAPMVGLAPSGRRMFRRFPEQSPAAEAADPEADAAMIAAWHQLIDDVSLFAPRFKLAPGEAVVVDNYRVFHGREPYSDWSRKLWRVWTWTTAGNGVPDGLLHSDSRFAGVTP
jgi:alpha-ketoglutarate-dependent taurine dioxygenase